MSRAIVPSWTLSLSCAGTTWRACLAGSGAGAEAGRTVPPVIITTTGRRPPSSYVIPAGISVQTATGMRAYCNTVIFRLSHCTVLVWCTWLVTFYVFGCVLGWLLVPYPIPTILHSTELVKTFCFVCYAGSFIYTGERDITPARSSKKRRRLLRLDDNLKIIVLCVPEILLLLRN